MKSWLVASLDGHVARHQIMSLENLKHRVSQRFCDVTKCSVARNDFHDNYKH